MNAATTAVWRNHAAAARVDLETAMFTRAKEGILLRLRDAVANAQVAIGVLEMDEEPNDEQD